MLSKHLFKLVAALSLVLAVGGAMLFLFQPLPGQAAVTPAAAITRLTHDPANALRPAWSPDNQQIAFESGRDGPTHIYVMARDGSGQRRLTDGANDDRHPVWSANGQTIVYDSADDTHQDIWSVAVADGSRRQLTHLEGRAEYAALSPDGRQLVFYLYQDLRLNLWTARADGSEARSLTQDLADAGRNEPTMAWRQAGFSPDSQWLAYTGGDGRSIWVMRRDGSEARPVVADGETNHFPWFLADGRLAYITEYVPPKYDGAWTNAWAFDIPTGQRTLLQGRMSMQGPVDFSADGTQILFHSPRGAAGFDVYMIDVTAPGGLAALQGTAAPAVEETAQ